MKQIGTDIGTFVIPQDIYDRSEEGGIIKSLETKGAYQSWVDEWAKEHSKPNSVVLDVGANIGSKTLPFARMHEGSVEVIAFEPVRVNIDILEELVRVNQLDNVKIEPIGLSNKTTTAQVNFPSDDFGLEATRGQGRISEEHIRNHASETVELKRLDDLDIKNISFIKVDIEGDERQFIEGAEETLKRQSPAVVLEIFNQVKNGVTRGLVQRSQKCFELMSDLGYKRIDEGKWKDALFIR